MTDIQKPFIPVPTTFTYLGDQAAGFRIGSLFATDNVGVTGFQIKNGTYSEFFEINNSGELFLTEAGAAAMAPSNSRDIEPNLFSLSVTAQDAAGNVSDARTIYMVVRDETQREQAAVLMRDISVGISTYGTVAGYTSTFLLTPFLWKFKSINTLNNQVKKLTEQVIVAQKVGKVLEPAPYVGFLGKKVELTASQVLRKLKAVEDKIQDTNKIVQKIANVVEPVNTFLSVTSWAAIPLALYFDHFAEKWSHSQQNMKAAHSLVPTYLDFVEYVRPGTFGEVVDAVGFGAAAEADSADEIGSDMGGGVSGLASAQFELSSVPTQAATAASTFSLEEMPLSVNLEAFRERLDQMNEDSNAQFLLADEDAAEILAFIEEFAERVETFFDAFLENPAFELIVSLSNAITSISSVLDTIFGPIQTVLDAVGPLLDAMDSIFSVFLKPFEDAVEWAIEATGIDEIINYFVEQIESQIGNLDLLDDLNAQLTQIFLVDFPEQFRIQIEEPYNEFIARLESPDFPGGLTSGDEGNNVLTGSLFGIDGPLLLEGFGGDDNLYGGAHDDVLRGGAGSDYLIGGGGNDTLDGGDNPFTTITVVDPLDPTSAYEQDVHEPDFVVYEGSRDDYSIVAVIGSDGLPTGRWIIADNRTDAQIAASPTGIHNGIDELTNIEMVFWDDKFLDLTAFDTFIDIKSVDGSVIYVGTNRSDIPNVPDPSDPNGPGIEVRTGDLTDDLVIANAGVDEIHAGGGNDQLNSGTNGPLSRTLAVGDILFGGDGNDVYVAGRDTARYDFISDSGGIDTVDYSEHRGPENEAPSGLTIFLGVTEREEFYRPVTVAVDVDYQGRAVNPVSTDFVFDRFNAGVVRGIENVIGSNHVDILIGTDGINKLNGGDGDDQVRGLDGDDILLGGGGSDILIGDGGDDYLDGGSGSNTYIGGAGNDTIVDISSDSSKVKYATFASTDEYVQDVEFVDFAVTGFDTANAYDMPGSIAVFSSGIDQTQYVAKYRETSIGGDPELIGIDTLMGVEQIVAAIGNDTIVSAAGVDQKVWGNDGNDLLFSSGGGSTNEFFGGPGDDVFTGNSDAFDTFTGGADSDTVVIQGDTNVDGDLYFGDDNRAAPLNGNDVFDLRGSVFSWHIYMNPIAPNGGLEGKNPLSELSIEDPLFIQPTLGVNGVVAQQSGVVVPGELYPTVPLDLRFPDPNLDSPGGRVTSFGEFEIILGSEQRDFLVGGNPDFELELWGFGGNDVIYAAQRFSSKLHGGEGNDVLGTYNDSYGTQTVLEFFDTAKLSEMFGGAGNDRFVAGNFREAFDGGDGLDTLTFEVSTAAVEVDLTSLTLGGGYATSDILVGGIENVTGTQFGDTLRGDGQSNQLLGWDGADTLHGEGGADGLFGNDGDDFLYGGAGNDLLHGGTGRDYLDGGEGIDTVSFSLVQVHPKGGLHRVTDDTAGVTVDLESGTSGEDTLVSIENLQGGVGDDVFLGSAVANLLVGNLGNDLLDGRSGDDVLSGGEGNDTVIGGAGDDFVKGGAGVNMLDGGDDIDTLDYSSLDRGIVLTMAGAGARAGFDTGETQFFSAVQKIVWADSLPQDRDEDTPWQDLLAAGTTEDRYTYELLELEPEGPEGDLLIPRELITPERIWYLNPTFARNAADLAEVAFLPVEALAAEQQVEAIDDFAAATDFFKNIERIVGSKGDDVILGNADNTFFYGASGADTIDGGDGIDTASYEQSGLTALDENMDFGITADLQNQIFIGGDAEGDVLLNIENIVGTSYDDRLTGDGKDNRLTLGLGDDFARGGGGTDTVVFEFSSVGVIFQFGTDGLQVIHAAGEIILSNDHVGDDVEFLEFRDRTLSFAQARNLVVDGTSEDDLLIGTPITDTIFGYGGDDIIEGRESADILDGGDDNDLLKGGGGNDRLIGGGGIDRFIGGPGDDSFVLDSASEIVEEAADEGKDTIEIGLSFTLPEHVEVLRLSGRDALTGTGNASRNELHSSADGNNTLIGLGDEDSLFNTGGQDVLIGGAGSDLYSVMDVGTVVVETKDGGTADRVLAYVNYTVPEHVEIIEARSVVGIELTGGESNEVFVDYSGNNRFDGGGGIDELLILTELSEVDLSYDFDTREILITTDEGTDRLNNIDFVRDTKDGLPNQLYSISDILDLIFPREDVRLDASHPFDNKRPIDMTPEGGGAQFLHVRERTGDSNPNPGNEYIFETAFEDGGKGVLGGSNFLNANAQATRLAVDFSGGNTFQMYLEGFDLPLQTMKDADWDYYQIAIFGGNDLIKGSYFDDKLLGYRGDDVIFGGLGDKESYNVFTDFDINPVPPTITVPGDVASDPAFFVPDGDDTIDGGLGNDTIDGGTGADVLLGGEGDDVLFGGGGLFSDRLDGGGGNDRLSGGGGSDTFVLTLGMGHDLVHDFEVGVDTLDFSALSAAQLSLLTISVVDFDTVIELTDGSSMTLTGVELLTLPTPVIDISGSDLNGIAFDAGTPLDAVAVSGVGDINNDGFDDFAIGKTSFNFPPDFPPTVTVYLGDPDAPGSARFQIEAGAGKTSLAISGAGDFNNDMIDDLIIGSNGETHILFGKTTPFASVIRLDDLDGTDGFQINVAGSFNAPFVAGGFDFNGDGIDDVAIGASRDAPSGAAYVVFGSSGPFAAERDVASLTGANGFKLTYSGDFEDAGDSLSSAGDINGDGMDDLVIGVPFLSVTDPDGAAAPEFLGGAFVVFGTGDAVPAMRELSTLSADQGFMISSPFDTDLSTNFDLVGRNVSGGHDVNGDGIDDLLIGVGLPTSNAADQPARAYLIYGTTEGFGTHLRLEDLNGSNGTVFTLDFAEPGNLNFGLGSVAVVADVNNDGLADLVIGTNTSASIVQGGYQEDETGKVFVVYGNANGFGASLNLATLTVNQGKVYADQTGDGLGGAVASAGDVNGDGGTDIILGATKVPSVVIYGDPFENTPVSNLPLIVGTPTEEQTLTVDASGLVDPDGLGTFSYQWLRNGGEIQGQTGISLQLLDDDVGAEISVRISYVDGAGATEQATSAATIPVGGVNDNPEAADDAGTSQEDVPLTINVLANDTDRDGDGLRVTSVTQGMSGNVMINADGTVTYTPDLEFSGQDSFTYTVSDGNGGMETATVNVTFDAVNDAPVAIADTVVLSEDTTITFFPMLNDTDAEGDAFSIVGFTQPAGGTLVANGPGGLTYTPAANASGTALETATYTIQDAFGQQSIGTITFEVTPVDDPTEGTLRIIKTTDVFGNPVYTADYSQLSDLDGLPVEGNDLIRDAFIWRLNGALYDTGTGVISPAPSDAGQTLTVEADIVDGLGNVAFKISAATTAIPAVRAVQTEIGTQNVDIFAFDNLDAPTLKKIDLFDVTKDIVDLRQFELADAMNAVANAAAGSAILTFDDGSILQLDGPGVTPQSLTDANFLFASEDPDPVGQLIVGTSAANVLIGDAGDDTIAGQDGNDTLEGARGDDSLDGGAGIDTGVFGGNQASYTLTLSPTATTLTDRSANGEGTDQLTSIEFLDFGTEVPLFNGNPMNLDIFDGPTGLTAEDFGAIIELYIAYYNRAPDAIGLYYWGTEFSNGFSLPRMAENFFGQPETQATYASVLTAQGQLDTSDPQKVEAFVTEVYGNVLGRGPDQPGLEYWSDELLNNPDITPDIFILAIIGGAKNPSEPTQQTADDQAYLATKSDLGAYFSVIKGMSDIADATAALALFDGSEASRDATIAAIDGHYAEALDPDTGDFLMPLVGVIDDPFGVV